MIDRPRYDVRYFWTLAASVSILCGCSTLPNLPENQRVTRPRDTDAESRLHAAILTNDLRGADTLISRLADPDNFIVESVLYAREEILKLLLQHGANPNYRDQIQATPLAYAAGRNIALVKLLLTAGATVNVQDENGDSPLMYAVRLGYPMQPAGATKMDAEKWRRININAQEQSHEIVKLLLSKGAKVNLRNRNGLTALDFAMYPPTKSLLTEHGARFGKLKLEP